MARDPYTIGPPALVLLEGLLGHLLDQWRPDGTVRVHHIELATQGLEVYLRVRGVSRFVDGTYQIAVTVLDTGPERSLCRLGLVEGRGVGRILAFGLNHAPRRWLNEWLRHRVGEAVQLRDDTLLVHHRPLVRRLMHRTRHA